MRASVFCALFAFGFVLGVELFSPRPSRTSTYQPTPFGTRDTTIADTTYSPKPTFSPEEARFWRETAEKLKTDPEFRNAAQQLDDMIEGMSADEIRDLPENEDFWNELESRL